MRSERQSQTSSNQASIAQTGGFSSEEPLASLSLPARSEDDSAVMGCRLAAPESPRSSSSRSKCTLEFYRTS